MAAPQGCFHGALEVAVVGQLQLFTVLKVRRRDLEFTSRFCNLFNQGQSHEVIENEDGSLCWNRSSQIVGTRVGLRGGDEMFFF